MYNNIVNSGPGNAIFFLSSGKNMFTKCDRNNYYNGTNPIGSFYSNTITSISDIKALGYDSNSVNVNPNYKSFTDLHSYNVDIDGRAKPEPQITKDFDGETRSSTTPDVGADEFRLTATDAGISDYIKPTTGTQCMRVVIKNSGTNTLTSAKINWQVNGSTKTQYSWTGSLAKGDTDIVCLGNITFKRDTLYVLKTWTSAPNGGTDSMTVNDTLSTQFYPAMRGIYTIGGSSPDFTNFTSAVNALNQSGILDSVYFKVRNGTYSEQFVINKISGADRLNAITFESENKDSTKVLLQYNSTSSSSNNYVVKINGTNGLTFKKMTIRNFSSSYKTVFNISNGSKNLILSNNIIRNGDSTSSSSRTYLIYVNSNRGKNIWFTNNQIYCGSMGLYCYSDYSYRDENIYITNNIFRNQGYYGLYMYYPHNVQVSNNDILETSNSLYNSVYLYYPDGWANFNNNKVITTGANAYQGVYLDNYYSPTDTFKIYNNFISISNNQSAHALYTTYLEPGFIANNNLLNECTDSSSNGAAFYVYGGYLTVQNNNFQHTGHGYAMYNDYYYGYSSDNNNYHTNGSKFIYYNYNDYSNINDYITAENIDTASISVDPIYVSSSDLHVSAVNLNAAGLPVSFVTKDIDNENRGSTPDIGADEFTPVTTDVGVSKLISPAKSIKADTTDILVAVTNYGIDTITSVVVHMKINNDTLSRKSVIRTFASGDTVIVNMGTYIFKNDSVYNFTSWTSRPNGVTDGKPSNDTLKLLNRRTAMSGVYTIGGSAPNFTTFKAAINALQVAGIADSVRFRVRQGTYTEQLIIPPIEGAGARNSIIFESQDQDTSKVTLQYASTKYDTNWVVQFLGADGITFRYMRIKSYSSSNYNVVFDIRSKSENITLFRNNIEGPSTNYGSSDNALIRAQNEANHYLQILNNQLKYGDYGFYINGNAGSSPYINSMGLEIKNNIIKNPFYYLGYAIYCEEAEISGNTTYSDKYQYGYGIYCESIRNFKISNNQINMPRNYMGMYFYNCGNGSSTRNLLSNNSIIISNNNTNSYGIYAYYLYNTDILHNTVRVTNSNYTSYCLYQYSGSRNLVYNNIFANNGLGNPIYFSTSSTFDSCDYNDYYSSSSALAYINGQFYNTIADINSTYNWESHSLSVNPQFLGTTNNHVKEVTLNGAGKYFTSVPVDMDYETRDTIKPDIGADEFQLPPNDAGIFKILTPNKPYLSDTQQVKVVLKNYGGNPLYLVDIGWKFNGVSQTKKTWSDTLASGDTIHINLGKKFFHPDSAYSLKVWTSKPNGTADSITNNDTIQSINQYPALSGIYTIGGSSPDFNTFADAVSAMKRGGIIDSVRFDVRNGTYFEQLIIPYIVGAKDENSIIFQSEQRDSSKVFLVGATSSSANYVIRADSLWGATFRHMTFITSKTNYYNHVFEILNGSGNIKIHDCNLIGKTTSTGAEEAIIYCYNSNSNKPSPRNIEVYNNKFMNGAFGFYDGYGYSNQGNSRDYNIHHNIFEDQYYMGLYLYYVNNFKVNYNQIYHKNPMYSSSFGIYAQYNNEGFEIIGNNIYDQEYYGIYLYSSTGSAGDTSLIANNFIQCKASTGMYGAIIYYPNYLNIVNNNFHVLSSNSGATSCFLYQPSSTFAYNNNYTNTGSGYAFYIQGGLSNSNFNNFYTAGTNLIYRSGTTYSTLGGWQTATGLDNKSINTNPDYVASNDLHVRSSDLNGKAKRIPYLITKDIDGELRDTTASDIGADEFKIPGANDAGIFAYIGPVAPFKSGVNSVKVYIKNYGTDTLKTATIRWRVNGVIQSNKSWTGKLKTGQTDSITVGTYNFLSGKKHDLQFWTISPNGVTDTINYNDSFTKRNVYPALKGVYTVEGSLPDFSTLGDAFTALKLGGVADTVWFKMRTGTYTYDLSIGDYPGANPKRPVYIESQSGDSSDVVFVGTGYTNQIILVNGADYIKFKKLTISPAYYNGIAINGVSKGIGFENCHFNLQGTYYSGAGVYSPSDKDDSTTVQGCRFDNGAYGVYLYGYNSTEYEKNTQITRCLFNNQYYYSIYLQYQDAPVITKNIINNNLSNNQMVYIYSPTSGLTFSYNKVISTSGNGLCMYIYNAGGSSSKRINIFNNFFSAYSNGYSQNIVVISSANFVNFVFNSLNVYGSGNPIALYTSSITNFDFRNNIVSNPAGGRVLYFNSNSISQANYNDLYTSGSTFGYYNSTDYSNLAAWKSATSRENNSLNLDPNFTSSTDLHSNLSSLDSACLPISGYTDDIDFETRNTSRADIGADEFQSLPDNLGISAFITPVTSCGLDSTTIKVKIFNYGNKSQVNFPIRYRIDAGSIVSATITDTIKPGKEVQYQFAKRVALAFNTTYKITGWTDLSNEKYGKNDTTKTTFTNYSVPDTVKSMVPANNTSGLDYPISLSWLPASGATKYDLYYWKSSGSKPSSPNVSNITQISYQITGGLSYGETYYWQIVSRNPVCNTPGLVKAFSMRYLPDLVV
jgi:hypothetical protein